MNPKPPSETPEPVERTANHLKSRGGLGRIVRALGYSLKGLRIAWQREAAFRQELLLTAVLIPIALLLPVSPIERFALISPLLLTLVVELLNSAVEAVVDRISLEHHPLSGQAKDLGSAAVLICLLLVVLSWVLIAGPVMLQLV